MTGVAVIILTAIAFSWLKEQHRVEEASYVSVDLIFEVTSEQQAFDGYKRNMEQFKENQRTANRVTGAPSEQGLEKWDQEIEERKQKLQRLESRLKKQKDRAKEARLKNAQFRRLIAIIGYGVGGIASTLGLGLFLVSFLGSNRAVK